MRVDEDGYFELKNAWAGVSVRALVVTKSRDEVRSFITPWSEAALVSEDNAQPHLVLPVVPAARFELRFIRKAGQVDESPVYWALIGAHGATVARGEAKTDSGLLWLAPGHHTLKWGDSQRTVELEAGKVLNLAVPVR